MKFSRGMSLIELMISILLASIVSTALFRVYLNIKVFEQTQLALSRMQEHARLVTMILQREIRLAGYWGCRRHLDSAGRINHANDIRVYQAMNNHWRPQLPNTAPNTSKTESDIVAVMHLTNHSNHLLQSMNDQQHLVVSNARRFKPMDLLMIANCEQSESFIATEIKPLSKINGQIVTTQTLLSKRYSANTYVSQIVRNYFYIKQTSYKNAQGQAIDALFEKTINGQVEELVPGIQRLKVKVGVEDRSHKLHFILAGQVQLWQRVVALKLNLLLNSINRVSGAAKFYNFMGKSYPNPEQLMHKSWAITIVLPNRLQLPS